MLRANPMQVEAREGAVEDCSQERRPHVFAINTSPEFLNIIRELFQEEGYNVTTTNFAPNSFAQIEALHPDALIIDIAIGLDAGWELLEQLDADADTAGIPALVASTDPRLPGPGFLPCGQRLSIEPIEICGFLTRVSSWFSSGLSTPGLGVRSSNGLGLWRPALA